MNEWAVVFLGIMALASMVQCAFVVYAALILKRTGGKVEDVAQKFDTEIRPTLMDLRQGAANLRAISDAGREQAQRVEALLATTLENIETTLENVRGLVAKPIATLSDLTAVWGGLRRGFEAYRGSEPRRRQGPPLARRAEDSDEHMFIG